MRTIFTTLLALIISFSTANAQEKTKTIFRYGEEVHIRPDTEAQAKKLTATAKAGKVYLGWTVYNNCKPGIYVIERSENGTDFEVIGFKKGVASSIPLDLSFYYTDNEPLSGKISYKVTHIAEDNTYFEFVPVTVKTGKEDTPAVITAEAF